jgi:NADH:ubiquinone oxidoreductase subunit E
MKPTEIDWNKFSDIIDSLEQEKWGLIPLLQKVQEAFGFIPPESI